MRERAVLIVSRFDSIERDTTAEEALAELVELSAAAGVDALGHLVVRQKTPNPALLVGTGKAEELRRELRAKRANVAIFESDLSSTQQRNLEDALGVKTIDRTQLILDIFAQRARSLEGKIQVELAQLKYLLPRLSGKGIALSRLGGGVGTRGPGEQKLEVDRRRIRERIVRLSRELAGIDRRRLAGIDRKKEIEFPLIALVGYTNAGKSSLFNTLTASAALVRDQLFSTLDTTTRKIELAPGERALLSDTVGFVRDLPHHLIESFKATLEETVHADLLLHVCDAGRPDCRSIVAAVEEVLSGLGADPAKILTVYNKADLLGEEERRAVDFEAQARGGRLVSAKTGEGLAELRKLMRQRLPSRPARWRIFLPKDKLGLAHVLYEEGQVLERQDRAQGALFEAWLHERVLGRFKGQAGIKVSPLKGLTKE